MNKITYIKDVLDKEHAGWLNGLTFDGITIPLCYGTKVVLLNNERKWQVIKVMEGSHAGTTLTIPFRYRDSLTTVSYLSKEFIYKKTLLKLNKSKKILEIKDVGYFAVEIASTIIEGDYKLQIPERPIKKILNPNYYDENIGGSRFAQTWFCIIRENENYGDIFLHYGSYSTGCITVINSERFSAWNKIYLALMNSRLNNRYVASMLVV